MLDKEFMCPQWVQSAFNVSSLNQNEKLVFLVMSCCMNEHGKGEVSFGFIKQKTKLETETLITIICRLKELSHIENITESSYQLVTFNTEKGSSYVETTAA